ncbi:DUF3883 domain-containing protein [Streptosporangium canum]|nr:DUF3883 domain-containing protein [Streptosporangium canum]
MRWVNHLQHSSIDRTYSLFASHPAYRDLTLTQYSAALSWLRDTGVIDDRGRPAHVSGRMEIALLKSAFLHANPLWLQDADQLITTANDLPQDASAVGEALGLSSHEVLAAVRMSWGKIDTRTRQEVGSAGELALLRLLQEIGSVTATHVAAYADGLGYDVSVEGNGLCLHLEIKSTTRRGRLSIYLSRNEFEVMLTDPKWRLVVVLVGTDKEANAIGMVDSQWITDHAPVDTSSLGRWESVRLDIPPGVARSGITDLNGQVSENHLLLAGAQEVRPSWLVG